ncbi:hypothetical protein [Streptomyces sp. bgisy022]|uniref:hypothetical protein n=1 Tax=Streptomyces sp. bgisy022 TaxID=3413769 RepID=UPI003D7134F6
MTEDEYPEPSPEERFRTIAAHLAENYWRQMDALLEVVEVAAPQLDKLDTDYIPSVMSPVFDRLSKEEFRKITSAFDKWGKEFRTDASTDPAPSLMRIMWDSVKSEPWGAAWMQHLHETMGRPPRLPIFLQSTTVSAVSNFEVLLSGLVSCFYEAAPQALDASSKDRGKEFSLRELKEMKSLEDAIQLAIDRRVEEFMFGSFSDWRKFFQDKMNLKFENYAIHWPTLQEIFQRRHVIVHNGGLASRRYLRSVDPTACEGVQEGDALEVDDEYLRRAASELLCFGFLLTSAMSLKFAKDRAEETIADIHNFTYKNLVKGRNELVIKCSSYGLDLAQDMDDELIFRVNRWIARKRIGEKRVIEEVEAWDVRPLNSRYALAKHCLLEEKDAALTELQNLIETGEVDFESVIEWPLLDPLRGTRKFQEIVRTMEVPEDWRFTDQILFENPKTATLHTRQCSLVRSDFKRRSVGQIDISCALLCKRCRPTLH